MTTDPQTYTSKLRGSRALVVGGSSGFGFGVACALIEHGATVVITSSNPSRLSAAESRLRSLYPNAVGAHPERLTSCVCDLDAGGAANEGDNLETALCELLETATAARTKPLDHVVWTAGRGGSSSQTTALGDVTIADMQRIAAFRVFGPMLLAKLAPTYLAPGPAASITLTAGTVYKRPRKGWSLGVCVAGGVEPLVGGLAVELAPLRVNAVCAGLVDTEFWDFLDEGRKEGLFASVRDKVPTGRVAKVEHVVESFLVTLKDENMNGEVVMSHGGELLV